MAQTGLIPSMAITRGMLCIVIDIISIDITPMPIMATVTRSCITVIIGRFTYRLIHDS